MSLVFHSPGEAGSIKPFESFPFEIRVGTSLAILFSDPLSHAVLLSHLEGALLEKTGEVYHINVGRASPPPIRKVVENVEGFYFARTVRFGEVMASLREIPEEVSFVIDSFPHLKDVTTEGLLELIDTAGSKSITLVLSHSPLILNELDLPGEFQRNFILPEIFDYLIAVRTASYRGHYRMGISLLRAPAEEFSYVGEHTVPIDAAVKKVL